MLPVLGKILEVRGNSISSYSFQDIGMRFAAFYSQLICAKIYATEFWILASNFFWLWRALKNLRGKKLKFRCDRFFKNLVVSVLVKFEVEISKTLGDGFAVHLFFNKNWQHCKLATVRIFKISLIDSLIDTFKGGGTVFGIVLIFLKKSFWWGG